MSESRSANASLEGRKMTYDDLVQMFGGAIPMEAMEFIFHSAPSDMTVRDARNHLEEMAERWRAQNDLRRDIRECVSRGWCQPLTSKKEFDPDLAEAITDEVMKLFQANEMSGSKPNQKSV